MLNILGQGGPPTAPGAHQHAPGLLQTEDGRADSLLLWQTASQRIDVNTVLPVCVCVWEGVLEMGTRECTHARRTHARARYRP